MTTKWLIIQYIGYFSFKLLAVGCDSLSVKNSHLILKLKNSHFAQATASNLKLEYPLKNLHLCHIFWFFSFENWVLILAPFGLAWSNSQRKMCAWRQNFSSFKCHQILLMEYVGCIMIDWLNAKNQLTLNIHGDISKERIVQKFLNMFNSIEWTYICIVGILMFRWSLFTKRGSNRRTRMLHEESKECIK